MDSQPWSLQAGHSIMEIISKKNPRALLDFLSQVPLICLPCFHCSPCSWRYLVLHVSYLTQSYPSGAGRDGNDIKLKLRGRVNYSMGRKVMAQYWLKAWDFSTDEEKAEGKKMGKIISWDFVFPDNGTAADQFSGCREGMLAGGKHDRCVVIFLSGLNDKCSSEILPMQSRVRVWKGGRVAVPVFWKYVLQMSNRWSPQHQQPFQAGLLTLQASQVFETGKGSDDEVPSTTNNYPRALNICSFTAFSNTAYFPHLTTYKTFFGKGWMKCLDSWRYSLSFDTPAFYWTKVTGICALVTDGSRKLIVQLMFNIQQLVSIILAAVASVVQQIVATR